MRTFADLAEKLKIDVIDLMRQCNGKVPPSKAVVLRAIWRSLGGDIWRRGSSIPAFRGIRLALPIPP
jgi:hypothetical protein